MALLGKRRGAFGIAFQHTGGVMDKTKTMQYETYVLPCESANIESAPVTYERVSSISADPLGRQQSGFEYSWSVSGAELDGETLGYLLFLLVGSSHHVGAGIHQIPQVDTQIPYSSAYFTIFKDHGGAVNSTNEVEKLTGCRIDSLTIEQPHKGYLKVSMSGLGMSRSYGPDDLDRTPTYGGLGWHDLVEDGGATKGVGYNLVGATPGTYNLNDVVKSFKIEFKRDISRAGMNYASNNPSDIVEGGRSVNIEVVTDARAGNSDQLNLLSAADGGTAVWWKVKWLTAAAGNITIEIPASQITGNVKGELGTGTDPQEWTFSCEGYRNSADEPLFYCISQDSNTTAHNLRVGS